MEVRYEFGLQVVRETEGTINSLIFGGEDRQSRAIDFDTLYIVSCAVKFYYLSFLQHSLSVAGKWPGVEW